MNSFDEETVNGTGAIQGDSNKNITMNHIENSERDLSSFFSEENTHIGHAYNSPNQAKHAEAPLISFGLAAFSWDIQRGRINFSGDWGPITGPIAQEQKSIRFLLELVHPEDYGSIYLGFSDLIHGRLFDLEREVRLSKTQTCHEKWILIRATTERGEFGQVLNVHGGILDITAYKTTEKKVALLSRTDPMTGLPNRQHLLQHIEKLHNLEQHTEDDFTHKTLDNSLNIVILDIDRFRRINESLGEETGDKIIKLMADRLQDNIPKIDFLARLGGDQFALAFLTTPDDPTAALKSHDKIKKKLECLKKVMEAPLTLSQELSTQGQPLAQISLEVNMGLRRSQISEQTPAQTLLRDASLALRETKENSARIYSEFYEELHEKLLSSVQFENVIRQALAEDWIHVHYQPVIDSVSGKAIGFEALARIIHPVSGIISPGIFIPVAEETGQIRDITEVIIQKSMRQLADWLSENPLLKDMTMAINLSPVQFEDDQILEILQQNLEATGLEGKNIKVEVTESLLIKSMNDTRKILDAIKEMGIQICIDDFGTGYSSLSYIRNYEFDTLKIDRSFIEHITNEPRDAELVRSIIQMGQNVGMKIIVEGVENEEQQALLTQLGCNYVQGFLVARPLPADKITPWLACNNMKSRQNENPDQ